ncbi:uncharacterized protein LY79DRAFT_536145 [Colletotrichum navitas]|uniref:Uncharacterized protein n=1 Tax=Colletotrichum navitas TaxID=681940 RepID=A0AAD8QET1_9PEZI|nr:uncharacterized protein LY79DRAFT_536145 [Colletotrichum navitas]KAK1599804.1 hypothetical protein LY79DRAFT_536145 [Colletotrichum navitas]
MKLRFLDMRFLCLVTSASTLCAYTLQMCLFAPGCSLYQERHNMYISSQPLTTLLYRENFDRWVIGSHTRAAQLMR